MLFTTCCLPANFAEKNMNTPRFLFVITVLNVLIASGFAIAGVVNPALVAAGYLPGDPAARVLALYAAARTLPLAVLTMIAILNGNETQVRTWAYLAGFVQLLDGSIGIFLHDMAKSIGPFVLAVLQFFALSRRTSKK